MGVYQNFYGIWYNPGHCIFSTEKLMVVIKNDMQLLADKTGLNPFKLATFQKSSASSKIDNRRVRKQKEKCVMQAKYDRIMRFSMIF